MVKTGVHLDAIQFITNTGGKSKIFGGKAGKGAKLNSFKSNGKRFAGVALNCGQ